jgi:predicted NAD-dependent protein-ADP-ribosyltransferase YbiA (DUF1768 family)
MTLINGLSSFSPTYEGLFSSGRHLTYNEKKKIWEVSHSRQTKAAFQPLLLRLVQDPDIGKVPHLARLASRVNELQPRAEWLLVPNSDIEIVFSSRVTGYDWLSNFFLAAVPFKGRLYPSSELAYQTAVVEFVEPTRSHEMASIEDPLKAKRLARSIEGAVSDPISPSTLNQEKLQLLAAITNEKFSPYVNPKLSAALVATYPHPLIEGTEDSFWGRGRGDGLNHFGHILEATRDALRNQ